MHSHTVLLVEDEPVTRLMIEARLRAAGYHVQAAASAEAALAMIAPGRFAVLLTDLLLDLMDGIALIGRARAVDPELEVIVLTGSATLDSAIAAVDHGAYAYLRKPVGIGELEERVGAAIRRRGSRTERMTVLRQMSVALLQIAEPQRPGYTVAPPATTPLRVGALEVDVERRRVTVAGNIVALSSTQFELLHFLAHRVDKVQSAELLAREVLGYDCHPSEARELIKATVHRLRHKIERDPRAPAYLVSIRGAGYMLSSGE